MEDKCQGRMEINTAKQIRKTVEAKRGSRKAERRKNSHQTCKIAERRQKETKGARNTQLHLLCLTIQGVLLVNCDSIAKGARLGEDISTFNLSLQTHFSRWRDRHLD